MQRSITGKQLSDLSLQKALFPQENLVNINGKRLSRTRHKARINVMEGMQKLSDKMITNRSSNPSLTEEAVTLLGALGASMDSTKDRNFDLVSTQTDEEIIQNPNIQDRNLKNMKPKQVSATGKFVNPDDPFYSLDDAQPLFRQTQAENVRTIEQPDRALQRLAADIVYINISPLFDTKLLQFG